MLQFLKMQRRCMCVTSLQLSVPYGRHHTPRRQHQPVLNFISHPVVHVSGCPYLMRNLYGSSCVTGSSALPARGWIARLDDQLLEIERMRERIAQLQQDNQGLQQTITQLQQENQRLQQQSAPQQEPC